ncbi:MAG: RidA family protein [Clostridiales bacterium]|mgnify:CR=1 FL=1|jgi:enamine deaminase RidA (YjgF/YER057c/UK114 family)|nr:RidA family protein [Clostridiales bacterium]
MSTAEERLKKVGLSFPPQKMKGQGSTPYKIVDDLLFIGGVAPYDDNGKLAFKGRVGSDLTIDEGYQAARLVGLNMLRFIRDALGDLDKVDYIVKVTAMVSGIKGFSEIYRVAGGFSDLMTEVFGERGMHARMAVGASTLNDNAPIICDAIIKIRD